MESIIRKHLGKVDVLPLSPTLLPKLLPKLSDVDANFDEVVEIIALDPSLTSKLLQICNSAYFGHESEVTSVAEAVSRVGYQAVYLLVAMISGSGCFPSPSPKGIDATKLWRHSLTTAFNAKFVAESANEDGNSLFTAGLLHDMGKVILAQELLPEAAGLFRGPSDAASLAQENAIFGCTHAGVGAALLENWKLPEQTFAAVRHSHDPERAEGFERLAACVALGNIVAHSQDNPGILEQPEFSRLLDFLKLSPDLLGRWNERLRDNQGLVSGLSHLPL
ncbi:MAG: HDOD domain-containing protein [Verrucomicrobiota bacterium]|jgi:putative nucleotidyltransferase with HDIG domain